jgi:predicted Zn finger-like uncharacterized protein
MIITCPSCSTRFLLDEADMPERGRKVRCARCSHVWHEAAPIPHEGVPPENTPQPVADKNPSAQTEAPLGFAKEPEPSPAPTTPQLETRTDEAEPEPKSKKPLVWVLIILLVLGAAAGGAAFFMPDQLQKLLGNNKPEKPAVVAVPAGWGKAPAAEPAMAAPAEITPEEASPETAPVLTPNDSAIFSDAPEGSAPTPLSVE